MIWLNPYGLNCPGTSVPLASDLTWLDVSQSLSDHLPGPVAMLAGHLLVVISGSGWLGIA